MRAIRFEKTGGPDVLEMKDIPTPTPGPGQLLVRNTSIGINFIDTYHRGGLYKVPLPSGLGGEAAGIVEAVGADVSHWAVGDRAAFLLPLSCYAEYCVVDADRTLRIPEGVDDDTAAATLLKGMTVRALIKVTRPINKGDTIVWHAAAGGVGVIATQWAAHLGARVIGVVGSEEKVALARANGCAEVIVSSRDDIAKKVRELTNGQGVPVVYDSVGKDTFTASLDSLALLGMMVSFGNASGPAPALEPLALMTRGSLFFTRPNLGHYTTTPELLRQTADDLFTTIKSGAIKIPAPRRYKLADAAQAHRDIESRKTTGSLVLIP